MSKLLWAQEQKQVAMSSFILIILLFQPGTTALVVFVSDCTDTKQFYFGMCSVFSQPPYIWEVEQTLGKSWD